VIDPGGRTPPGGRRQATVREVTHPNRRSVRLRLDVPDRIRQLAGQHYVVRLTAPDGYVAQRSYSVASAPSDPLIELFVERLDDGEVSAYLADVVEPGDQLEVQGPIGGWFVWDGTTPAVGVAGGSGVVPLIAMLREAVHLGRQNLVRLVVSSRTRADLPYSDELSVAAAHIALTREDNGGRPAGRITAADLEPLIDAESTYFVCGSSAFAETASTLLTDLGVDVGRIRVERFGASG
jgi:ferredoxin-NADP reductase